MKNNFENMDDLFKSALGSYTEGPPPAVWDALEKRLDGENKKRPGVAYRWFWVALSLCCIMLLSATFAWKIAGNSVSQRAAHENKMTVAATQQPVNDDVIAAGSKTTSKDNTNTALKQEKELQADKRLIRPIRQEHRQQVMKNLAPASNSHNAIAENNDLTRRNLVNTTQEYTSKEYRSSENMPESITESPAIADIRSNSGAEYAVSTRRQHNIMVVEATGSPEQAVKNNPAPISEPDIEDQTTFGNNLPDDKMEYTENRHSPKSSAIHAVPTQKDLRSHTAAKESIASKSSQHSMPKTPVKKNGRQVVINSIYAANEGHHAPKKMTNNAGKQAIAASTIKTEEHKGIAEKKRKVIKEREIAESNNNKSNKVSSTVVIPSSDGRKNTENIAALKHNTGKPASIKNERKPAALANNKIASVPVMPQQQNKTINEEESAVAVKHNTKKRITVKDEKNDRGAEKDKPNSVTSVSLPNDARTNKKIIAVATVAQKLSGAKIKNKTPAFASNKPALAAAVAVPHHIAAKRKVTQPIVAKTMQKSHTVTKEKKNASLSTVAPAAKNLPPNNAKSEGEKKTARTVRATRKHATIKEEKALVSAVTKTAKTPIVKTEKTAHTTTQGDKLVTVKTEKSVKKITATKQAKTVKTSESITTASKTKKTEAKSTEGNVQQSPVVNKTSQPANVLPALATNTVVKAEPAAIKVSASAIAPKTETKPANARSADSMATKATDAGASAQTDSNTKKSFWKKYKFEAGIKAGYEGGFSSDAAKKIIVSPYVECKLTSKISLMLQPSFKTSFTSANGKTLSGTQHFNSPNGDSIMTSGKIDTIPVISGGTIVGYLVQRNYNYSQSYNSIVKSYALASRYQEYDLPLLLKYKFAPGFSVYGGVNITYSKLIQINEHTATNKLSVTSDSFTLANLGAVAPASPSTASVLHFPGTNISNYTGPLYPSPTGGLLRFGYMLGFSYEFNKRWMIDALIQQASVKSNTNGGINLNSALSAAYYRFTIGYKLKR